MDKRDNLQHLVLSVDHNVNIVETTRYLESLFGIMHYYISTTNVIEVTMTRDTGTSFNIFRNHHSSLS
jgi:hypothetical protein